MTVEGQRHLGARLADVSNGIVQIYSECYGRGPTKAKTYQVDNYLITVLEDIYTTVETTLIHNGHQELVRSVRLTFQESVQDRFIRTVADAMGRDVVSYHSQVVFEPPTGFEIFILAPEN